MELDERYLILKKKIDKSIEGKEISSNDKDHKNFGAILMKNFSELIVSMHADENYIAVTIKKENFIDLLQVLRGYSFFKFEILKDLWIVDLLLYNQEIEDNKRYEFNIFLVSYTHSKRILIKFTVSDDADLNTLTTLYRSGDWLEREVWEFFGIHFMGHTDLRRLLLDYGFPGNPLKKDFPLSGLVEIRYDDEERKLIFEKVEAKQPFLILEYLNPWFF